MSLSDAGISREVAALTGAPLAVQRPHGRIEAQPLGQTSAAADQQSIEARLWTCSSLNRPQTGVALWQASPQVGCQQTPLEHWPACGHRSTKPVSMSTNLRG